MSATYSTVDDVLHVDGQSLGLVMIDHAPTRDTVRHAESLSIPVCEYRRLTGMLFAFMAPDGIAYFEASNRATLLRGLTKRDAYGLVHGTYHGDPYTVSR